MNNVININDSPLSKMQKLLDDEKDKNKELKLKNGMFHSVNEMLKLHIEDLISSIEIFEIHLTTIKTNMRILQSKLPDFTEKEE